MLRALRLITCFGLWRATHEKWWPIIKAAGIKAE